MAQQQEGNSLADDRTDNKITPPTVEEFYSPFLQLSGVACLPQDPEQDDFTIFRDHMFCDTAPEGAIEKMLVDRLVALVWRLRRAGSIESQLFAMILPSSTAPSDTPAADNAATDGAMILQQLTQEAHPKEFNSFEWLQRYETHLDRAVHRTLAALQRQRYLRWKMSRDLPEDPANQSGQLEEPPVVMTLTEPPEETTLAEPADEPGAD